MKWEIVQQPKCKRGLGVGEIVIKNAALLFKWRWRYASEENSLWRRVVQSVHNEDQATLPSCSISKIPGPWQSTKRLLVEQQSTVKGFLQHLQISVSSGTKIRFWNDQWVGNFTLKDKFPSLFRLSTQQTTLISSMGWFEEQLWKWTLAWKRGLVQ